MAGSGRPTPADLTLRKISELSCVGGGLILPRGAIFEPLHGTLMDPDSRSASPVHVCALCGGAMKHVGSVPRFGVHPELATFECLQCRDVSTLAVEDGQR
jgi:hypothetical protein